MRTFVKSARCEVFRSTARRTSFAVVAVGVAAFAVLPAAACSILPPPVPPALAYLAGESESDYRTRADLHVDGFNALQHQRTRDAVRERQLNAWTRAEKVAVVEIVRVETEVEIPQSPMGLGVRSTVKPVGWLKGSKTLTRKTARAPFVLAHVSYTSCGPSPGWPIFSGKPGDRFVVFLNGEAPSQTAALDAVAPGDIVLGELTQALAAQVRQPK
jgi:hypothetical protein